MDVKATLNKSSFRRKPEASHNSRRLVIQLFDGLLQKLDPGLTSLRLL